MVEPFVQLLRVAIVADSNPLRAQLRKFLTEAKILVTLETELAPVLAAPIQSNAADVLLVAIHHDPREKQHLNQLVSAAVLPVVPYLHEPGQALDRQLIKKLKEAANYRSNSISKPDAKPVVKGLVIEYEADSEGDFLGDSTKGRGAMPSPLGASNKSRTIMPHIPSATLDDEDLQATQASSHQSSSISFEVDAMDVDISVLQTGETRAVVEWNVGSIVLDMYEIVGLIGEGAMGLVHRVFHRGWNMDLAVKTPRLEELQKAGAENFEREAETWVNLGLHPNIVSCYYVRRVGNVPRVFAEYINGGNLNDWIRKGKLTRLPQILDVMIQFAWGLHHAHSQGFVHQDVKPANVMLSLDGVAKVTDFGLTKGQSIKVGSATAEGVEDTDSLVAVGGLTPAYCSPEQVNELPLNYKADIWSWGVSVLEIFVGRLTWPFGPMAMEVLNGYLEKGPANPEIERMPEAVVAILRQCFQAKPTDRPQDLLAVARQLQTVYATVVGQPYPRSEPKQGVFTADTLNNRAVSLVDLGKLKDAGALWEQALAIQPHHPESTYNQGLLLWRSGRLADDGLLAELSAAEQSYPHACLYQYLRGLIHLERVDGAAAMDALNSIPKTDSRREALENVLNSARSRLGRAHWAIEQYDQEHLSPISGLVMNAQGEQVLSCSHDGRLKLWNVLTGHCYKTIQAHQRQLYAVAMQPTMEVALSAGEDSTIKIWNMSEGVQTGLLAGHTHSVYALWLSADGSVAVSGGEQAEVRVWHMPSARCVRVLKGHQGDVLAVGMTPNKRLALSAGADGILRVWDVKTGRCTRELIGHEQAITALAVSDDGRLALSGSADTTLRLWDVTQGTCLKVMQGNQQVVTAVAIKTKGKYAVSCGQDKTLRLWELTSGRCFRTYHNDQPIMACTLSLDGKFVVTGDKGWKIKRWDIDLFNEPYLSPMVLSQVHTSENVITALDHYEAALAEATAGMASQDFVGAALALRKARSQKGYGRGKAAVELWAQLYRHFPRTEFFSSWEELELNQPGGLVTAVQLSTDGSRLLTGSNEGYLKLWSIPEGQCLQTFRGHTARINAVALSQDGQLALSVAQHSGKAWDIKTGEWLFDLAGHNDTVSAVKISWNRRFAVTASHDKSLSYWELGKGRCLGNIGWHVSHINTIALSMDSQYLASGGGGGLGQQDYTVFLWDLVKSSRIASYVGHSSNVLTVVFNHKTSHLLSAGRDRLIKLWDIVTGECVRDFIGHEGSVHSLSLTLDDRFLVSADSHDQIKLWEVATGFCLHTFSGQFHGLQQVVMSQDARFVVAAGDHIRVLMLDWMLRERDWGDWDEDARYLLLQFLNQHTPYLAEFGAQLDSRQVSLALTQRGQPTWSEADFKQLLQQLGCAGFGWLRAEGVQQKLTHLAHYWRQTIKVDDITFTCPQCKSLKQRKPRCLECGFLLSEIEDPKKLLKEDKPLGATKKAKKTAAVEETVKEKPQPVRKHKPPSGSASDWARTMSQFVGVSLRVGSVIVLAVLIARYMKWV